MKKRATYQINDTFRITGRGIVFLGNISEGLVSPGDWIESTINGTDFRRKISHVEGIRPLEQENNCGLMIATINDDEIERLRNWEPNGAQATIFSEEEES